jgi:isopenicillin N synthase-like dioxygenase
MKYVLSVFSLLSLFLHAGPSTIPEVDMRDFYNPSKREAFIETVRDALHEYGFFAVTNTGIDTSIIDHAFQKAADFFSKPQDVKNQYSGAFVNFQRGYAKNGTEEAKDSGVSDFKEFLHFGNEATEEYTPIYENIWPNEIDMKETMQEYLEQLDKYKIEIGHVLALALGESEDFFDEMTSKGDNLLRAIHYPKIKFQTQERAIWAREHTDIDLFTILPKATEDGLEVLLPTGVWHPIHVEGDAFIINAGDFLEIFSNGYFRSSVHRVLAPLNNREIERYSMVYFVHPSSNTILSPLEKWVENGVIKFATATQKEMLMERLADIGLASDEGLKFLAESKVLERLMKVNRASVSAMKILRNKGLASDEILSYLKAHEENF